MTKRRQKNQAVLYPIVNLDPYSIPCCEGQPSINYELAIFPLPSSPQPQKAEIVIAAIAFSFYNIFRAYSTL